VNPADIPAGFCLSVFLDLFVVLIDPRLHKTGSFRETAAAAGPVSTSNQRHAAQVYFFRSSRLLPLPSAPDTPKCSRKIQSISLWTDRRLFSADASRATQTSCGIRAVN